MVAIRQQDHATASSSRLASAYRAAASASARTRAARPVRWGAAVVESGPTAMQLFPRLMEALTANVAESQSLTVQEQNAALLRRLSELLMLSHAEDTGWGDIDADFVNLVVAGLGT